jgi:Flp pilus assembly protein TadG
MSIAMTRISLKTMIPGRRQALALWRDSKGIVAVEFAAILPLLLTMFLGAVELSTGVAIDRKVTLTVRTVTDLVSQSSVITNADMTNILNAASKVMIPYPDTPLKIKVSAVDIAADGSAKVAWGDALNTTKRATNSSVTLPTALAVPNTQLIFGEIEYGYAPPVGYAVVGTITLNENFYTRPRQGATITRTP